MLRRRTLIPRQPLSVVPRWGHGREGHCLYCCRASGLEQAAGCGRATATAKLRPRSTCRPSRVPLDLREVTGYDALVKSQDKQPLRASQFLKLPPGEMVLVYVRGVDVAKVCKTNGIPFRRVKGLYAFVDSTCISSSRNSVAVRTAHLDDLRKRLASRPPR